MRSPRTSHGAVVRHVSIDFGASHARAESAVRLRYARLQAVDIGRHAICAQAAHKTACQPIHNVAHAHTRHTPMSAAFSASCASIKASASCRTAFLDEIRKRPTQFHSHMMHEYDIAQSQRTNARVRTYNNPTGDHVWRAMREANDERCAATRDGRRPQRDALSTPVPMPLVRRSPLASLPRTPCATKSAVQCTARAPPACVARCKRRAVHDVSFARDEVVHKPNTAAANAATCHVSWWWLW